MILCLGTTPAVQRVMVFQRVTVDAVNRALRTLDGAAGKCVNVAKVLKALDQEPVVVTFLGGDRGAFLEATLRAAGIDLDGVPVAPVTRECVTVIDQASHTQTELVEESAAVTPADFDALLAAVRRRVTGCRAVIMSGTLAPGGPVDLYGQGTRLGRAAGALTVVDAQGAALAEALKERPDLVKPNRAELAATVGRDLREEADLLGAMRELVERGAQRVVVTAGGGPTLAFDGRTVWRAQAPRIEAVNPIGSGDAFTAGLVAHLLGGDDLGEACRWATATGAANALTWMAGEVHLEDVRRLVPQVALDRV